MRPVSVNALQAMLAQDNPDPFIPLLKIEHDDLDAPILLAYNTETVSRSDGDYLPYAFQINLPKQVEDETPTLSVTVDNTDLEINDKIRSLVGKPSVTFMVVLASSPNTVEAGPFEMSLQQATADAQTITGTLGWEDDLMAQEVPAGKYTPDKSPGLFL